MVGIRANKGQPFLPEVIAAIAGRYSFQRFPTTVDEILGEKTVFTMGKWSDIQLEEMTTYGDGLIVRAKANNAITEAFVDDLYRFVLESFGLERLPSPVERRLYESAVVVQFSKSLAERFSIAEGLKNSLEGLLSNYGIGDYDYQPGGIQFDVDLTLHPEGRPIPFSLVRRIRTPFPDNYWFSSAPLRTDDHLEVLKSLEP